MTATPAQSSEITASTGGLRQSLSHIWLIARVEHRRFYRKTPDPLTPIATIVLSGLFILGASIGMGWWGYGFGTTVGTNGFVGQLPLFRLSVAAVALFIMFMMTLMTVNEYGDLDEPTPVLTAIPYWEAVCGRLLINHIFFIEIAAIPILVMAIAFAIGAGSIVSAPITAVALLAMVVFSTTVGFVIGQLIRLVIARSEFIAKYKTLIGIIVFVAYFGAVASSVFEAIFALDLSMLGETPLGWVADLGMVAVPTPMIGVTQPAIAAVTVVGGTGILTWVAIRISGILLYTVPVQPATDDSPERETPTATSDQSERLSERVFGGRVSRPTLRIAQKSWRRAYRAPLKLQFAAWPVFFLIAPVQQSIEAGEVSTLFPLSIALYGAWATGAAFTLNPLGDEGAVLPITLTSGVQGRQLLRGLVFAGIAVGGPPTVLLAILLGLASPLGMFSAVVTGILGGILCGGACALGASVGTALPKFKRTRLSRNRKAVVPGYLAFAIYSIVLSIVLLPGLFGGNPALGQWLGDILGLSTQTLALGGLAGTTLLAGGFGWIGLRFAEEKIDGYTPAL